MLAEMQRQDPANNVNQPDLPEFRPTPTGPTLTYIPTVLIYYRCASGRHVKPSAIPCPPCTPLSRLLSPVFLAVRAAVGSRPRRLHVVRRCLAHLKSPLGQRSATGILAIGFCTSTTPRHAMLCVVA
jgi:hypothetical protein